MPVSVTAMLKSSVLLPSLVQSFKSVAPLATPSSDVKVYWHTLEYTSTSLQQDKELKVRKEIFSEGFKLWNWI